MPFGRLTRRAHSRWLVVIVTLLTFAATTTPVWAWGRIGHRVIALLAEKQLSREAKAAIAGLLAPGESLADASLWADDHRRELPEICALALRRCPARRTAVPLRVRR